MTSLETGLPAKNVIPAPDSTLSVRRTGFMVVAVMVFAVFWQLRWGVVPDTSWIITMCEQVLSGSRLYIDIFEVNPPFTMWMFMPPVAVADALGLSPEVLVHAYSYVICLVGLGFAALIARRAGFAENRTLASMLPIFLAILVVFPGNAFSEREHLGVALLLPLLVLMAWRAAPGSGREPGMAIALFAGLCGSVLVLVKPYYALVVLVPALYAAWRSRSIWNLFVVEYWVIASACVIYVLSVLYFYPQFMDIIYPVLKDTYMRTGSRQEVFLKYAVGYFIALYALRCLRPGLRFSPLAAVFAIASLAATIPLLYQGKGWSYHAFPALSLMVAALVLRAGQVDSTGASPSGRAMDWPSKALLVVAIAANEQAFMMTQKPGANLTALIRASVERPSVALIGTGLAIGHPLTRMIGGSWISAYCADWLGDMAFRLTKIEERGGNLAAARHYDEMFNRYLTAKMAQLETARPTLILVQKQDALWAAGLFERRDFGRFMQDYRHIAEDPTVEVFLRNGVGHLSSSAAGAD